MNMQVTNNTAPSGFRPLTAEEIIAVSGGDGEIVVTANRVQLPGSNYAYVADANGDGRPTYVVFHDGWLSNPFVGYFTPDPSGNTHFQDNGYSFRGSFRDVEGEYTVSPNSYETFRRVYEDNEDEKDKK